jgi:ankyrin repeat protein
MIPAFCDATLYNHSVRMMRCVIIAAIFPWGLSAAEPRLIEVARGSDLLEIKRTLSSTVDVNVRGSHGQSALHEAAIACSLEIARLLIDAGADRSVRDDQMRTPAMLAWKCPDSSGSRDLVRALMMPALTSLQDERNPWTLQDAASHGNVELAAMLLKLGADVNAPGSKDNRALEIACRKPSAPMVRLLLEHGADPSKRTLAGTTVLHEAALGGSGEVIELLLTRGLDVNASDESRSTPLHYAASFGRVEAIKALLKNRADVQWKDNKGLTPLQVASRNGQKEAVTILRSVK